MKCCMYTVFRFPCHPIDGNSNGRNSHGSNIDVLNSNEHRLGELPWIGKGVELGLGSLSGWWLVNEGKLRFKFLECSFKELFILKSSADVSQWVVGRGNVRTEGQGNLRIVAFIRYVSICLMSVCLFSLKYVNDNEMFALWGIRFASHLWVIEMHSRMPEGGKGGYIGMRNIRPFSPLAREADCWDWKGSTASQDCYSFPYRQRRGFYLKILANGRPARKKGRAKEGQ